MSSLTDIEKRYLERILNMGGGYVLDYSDATYGEFFGRHKIDIHGGKYQTYGTSKAKKMRAFWEQEKASPKTAGGKVRQFHDWTLAHFIDVASDVGVLKLDVQKFSHGLRDFRNHIHPYQQMSSGFAPDQHTAKVCFQVLKAALASVAGERK